MQILQKEQLRQTKQQQNIVNEKRVMMLVDSPFCLGLKATVQTQNCLYMLLEFLQGGDLFARMDECDGVVPVRAAGENAPRHSKRSAPLSSWHVELGSRHDCDPTCLLSQVFSGPYRTQGQRQTRRIDAHGSL